MMLKIKGVTLAAIAVLFVSYADARPIRRASSAPRALAACAVDSPHFAARAQWRMIRADTLSEVVGLRQDLGLSDVPIDSIDYERNEVKCARVVAALNSHYSLTDSTNRLQTVTLISWAGLRSMARVNRNDWALFDSSQTFLKMMTTP
jgi:hypothetical protein